MKALAIAVGALFVCVGARLRSEMDPQRKRHRMRDVRDQQSLDPAQAVEPPAGEKCVGLCQGGEDDDGALVEVGHGVGEPHVRTRDVLAHADCNAGLTDAVPTPAPAVLRLNACRRRVIAAVEHEWAPAEKVIGRQNGRADPAPEAGNAAVTVQYAAWRYELDGHGRVVHAYQDGMTAADIANGVASNSDLHAFVNKFPPGGQAGHIRARCLGGDNELINFIPQNQGNNEGIQCALERTVEQMLTVGHCTLNVHIRYTYPPLNNGAVPLSYYRPTAVHYSVTVGAPGCDAGWPAVASAPIDVTFPNP